MSQPAEKGWSRHLAKGLGLFLVVLGSFPLYRVLDTGSEAPFRQGLVEMAEGALQFTWWGTLVVVSVAILLSLGLPNLPFRLGKAIGGLITRPPLSLYAVSVGILGMLLSLALWEFLYEGLYTSVDEMGSVIHARYLASGQWASPPLAFPEGWLIPNTLLVENGWVSQYPPSHLLFLSLFYRLGIPGLFGPVLFGLTAWLLALSLSLLLQGQEAVARVAALLTAASPFLLFIAPGGLSHITAGAACAALLYFGLRARDGHAVWGVAVGAAVGVMVSARPLTGLVLGTAIPLALWLPEGGKLGWKWGGRRAALTVVGGLPFAVLLGLYNHELFGHWTTFGYTAAYGSNHGLGFHLDPWGYPYGLSEALGFTSMDFLAAGARLLETPLPPTVLIGAYLLFGPRLQKGGSVLLAWGFLPLAANALYWFHEPRMLYEAAPAWIALASLCVAEMVKRGRTVLGGRIHLGGSLAWAVLIALVAGAAWGVPPRWKAYEWDMETLSRIRVPLLPTRGPSLVFVHTSWNERLSSQLQGAGGMRQDSIVSALRRNTSCELQGYADARAVIMRWGMADLSLPPLDHGLEAGAPPGLEMAVAGPGITVRTRRGETLTPECRRQVGADRFGAVALAPLVWQGDLPGIEEGRPMFVRDMGPEINDEIRALFPGREPFVFTPTEPAGPPAIVPYQEAMEVLWGSGS